MSYTGKRAVDLILSSFSLLILSPLLLAAILLVYLSDLRNPFYVSVRVGLHNKDFNMLKVRSMRASSDSHSYLSTAKNDPRITPVGRIIRKYKVDEISQFVNVLLGTMSVVGPRAQTRRWGTDLYTRHEQRLLSVRPGITDFSSVVFSDEDSILNLSPNPDLKYNQIIRPWKSRLSLFCIDQSSFLFDFFVISVTFLSVFNRNLSCQLISRYLRRHGLDHLARVASRSLPLEAFPPPGADAIEDGSFYKL